MAKFRYTDELVITEHGQTLGFAHWMGGPSLTYVKGVICEGGTVANWFKTDKSDTWFSTPGYIHQKGKRIKGFLSCEEDIYRFTAYKY
jgi:hypothetical protein